MGLMERLRAKVKIVEMGVSSEEWRVERMFFFLSRRLFRSHFPFVGSTHHPRMDALIFAFERTNGT